MDIMFRNQYFLWISVAGLWLISAFLYFPQSPPTSIKESTSSGEIVLNSTALPNVASTFALEGTLTFIPPQSLTAILPVLPETMYQLKESLEIFLAPSDHIREVIVICPQSIVTDVRRQLQSTFALMAHLDHTDVSLRPWQPSLEMNAAVLSSAAEATTQWVLVMDEGGLNDIEETMKQTLLSPPNTTLPLGPMGLSLSDHPPITSDWGLLQPACYLHPPFVLLSSSARTFDLDSAKDEPWIDLGLHISSSNGGSVGGLQLSADLRAPDSTQLYAQLPADEDTSLEWATTILDITENCSVPAAYPTLEGDPLPQTDLAFFLPIFDDLAQLMPLICRLVSGEEKLRVKILIYADLLADPTLPGWRTELLEGDHCTVEYAMVDKSSPDRSNNILDIWLEQISGPIQVAVALREMDPVVGLLLSDKRHPSLQTTTVIRIPRSDLEYTDWMSSLSLVEWRNWHKPRVEISIITKDRPGSLLRLMKSLASARYFGDRLDLRVNIEQDCDADSLKVAENLTSPFGSVFLHHRIVHGGLLPAIVESWYPQNNDSYGLLLEDDVELSPLFYAWIKMTMLRYRYGEPGNRNPRMFGISLYQQKHLELPPEGRQRFDPRSLFFNAGLPQVFSPYLSPVPCSWGAVYFPEHWREFHDYLASRLAESTLMIEDEVVPDVRSNHWTKSWKKFFIELVYLRGYVMLYPNFEDFVSLSTNHLEVGSHVRIRSQELQDLFLLPLMPLPKPRETCGLLSLPDQSLPSIQDLPVLNLTGFLTSLSELEQLGASRRIEILGCDSPTELYDAKSLMCINNVSESLASGLFR